MRHLNLFPKPVSGSADLERILGLPYREVTEETKAQLVEVVTNHFRLPGSTATLKPVQAWALYEMSRLGGLLGPIGVGHGKTLLNILAPMAVPNCRLAVLLLPPALKAQMSENWAHWAKHFRVPNLSGHGTYDKTRPSVVIISYYELQNAKATTLLESICPDLIVADEAHNLRHKKSARTGRVLRYLAVHPQTRVCAWSGTLTNKSILDYAHLSAICLKSGSPLPVHWATAEEWSNALDSRPRGMPSPAGALSKLCPNGETLREGFRKRLLGTPGVVATQGASVDCSLYILERKIETPSSISEALKKLRSTWDRPDGEKLKEGTAVAACARQLASGFYYRWEYPRKEPKALIDKWLEVRANYNSEIRAMLKNPKPHLDSEQLLRNAAQRHIDKYEGPLPKWESEYYAEWQATKDTVRPITVPVWVSDYLLEDCARAEKGSLIWYEHDAFAPRLAQYVHTFAAGDDSVRQEKGDRTVALSLLSHGTGLELQRFSNNVVANYPTATKLWEQFIGRTFRQGQKADEVLVQVYRHTPELRKAFRTAKADALYVKETQGTDQLLLTASYGFNDEEED